MRSARRPLKLSDLEALAARFAVELQPGLLYASADSLVQEVIGHRLFTLTCSMAHVRELVMSCFVTGVEPVPEFLDDLRGSRYQPTA